MHWTAACWWSALVWFTEAGRVECLGKLTAQVRQSSVIPMIGDGSQIQFLLHNEDFVRLHRKIRGGSKNHSTANFDGGKRTAVAVQKNCFWKSPARWARNLKFIPLPWRVVWAGLKSAELCGLKLNFRSDSLVSLMYQNQQPDFLENSKVGLACRSFQIEKLKL